MEHPGSPDQPGPGAGRGWPNMPRPAAASGAARACCSRRPPPMPPIRSRPWSTTTRSKASSRTRPGPPRGRVPCCCRSASMAGRRPCCRWAGWPRRSTMPAGRWPWPVRRLPGPGGDCAGLPGRGRVAGRRPGRRAPDRARGAGHPGRVRRRAVPGAELVHRDDPDRGRRPGRRRAGLRGRPGFVPGGGRPGQPERPAVEPGDPGPAGRPRSARQRPTCASSFRSPGRPGCAVSS